MSDKKRIDLLLLGKTGNGKSATGNTILRRKAFKSAASSTSVTRIVSSEVSEYKEHIIKVVDGPGIGDTRLDDEGAMNLVMEEMQTAIQLNPSGYHAFVLVIRFGARITKEDSEAVEMLKTTFGSLIVRNHCILLFTHGDIFQKSSEETGETFQQWYKSQEGALKNIIEECGERIVLFDNSSKDDEKICHQIDSLLLQVENLQMQGNRYCGNNFEEAKDAREKAKVLAKEPHLRDHTMVETSLIFQKLHQIQKIDKPRDKLQPLEELKSRTNALCDSIEKQDNGTGALHKLAKTVELMKQTVYNEADVTNRMIQEDEKRTAEEKKQGEEREASEKKFREQQEAIERKMDEDRREYEARLADQEKKRIAGEQKLREEREASEKKFREQQEALERAIDNERKEFEARLANEEKKKREEKEASDKKFREQQEAMKREMDDYRKDYEAKLADGIKKQREEKEDFEKKFREQQEAMTRKMDESKKEHEAKQAKEEKRQRKERQAFEKKFIEQQETFARKMDENKKEYQTMQEKQEEKRKAEKKKNKEELAKRDQELREQEAKLKEEEEKHRNEARIEEAKRREADMAWQRKQEETRLENETRLRELNEMYEKQRKDREDQVRERVMLGGANCSLPNCATQ